ncbi:DUF2520 domain-containing protein [soil metagenome]
MTGRAGSLAVFVCGAGRVGLAIARLARDRGMPVAGLWNPRPLRPDRAELAKPFRLMIGEFPSPVPADLWLITVPDDAIASVAERLIPVAGPRPKAAAHTAGALPGSLLHSLAAQGIACGSWHPAMTFLGTAADSEALAGATAALEGEPAALSVLTDFTRALGISHVVLAAGLKPHYHAALVLASNGRMALDAAAAELLRAVGLEPATARSLLEPLVERTERNLRRSGPAAALTGPAARGDVRTVAVELEALRDRPALDRLYRALAAVALDLVPPEVRGEGHYAVAERIR